MVIDIMVVTVDDIGHQSKQCENKDQLSQYWIETLVVKLRDSQQKEIRG